MDFGSVEEEWACYTIGGLEEGRCLEVPTSDSFPCGSYWDATGLAATVRGGHAYRTSLTDHTGSKQSHIHKALTETIGAQVSDFGRQLQNIERKCGDQQDTVIATYLETQNILKKLDCSAQSRDTQHLEIRDLLQPQAQEQSRARESQKSHKAQISDNLSTLSAQIEAMIALQQSLSGFVFPTPLIRQARSDSSDM